MAYGSQIFTGFAYNGGTYNQIWSNDGVSWTTQAQTTAFVPYGICNGSLTGVNTNFVAVGNNGTTPCCMTSTDGKSWTQYTLPGASGVVYYAVAWNGSVYCAVGSSGNVATSPDGVTWTARSGVTGNSSSIAWGSGVFVTTGGSMWPYSSPDGITWTQRVFSGSDACEAVAYGNGQFIAMHWTMFTYTSPDGINWTKTARVGMSYYFPPGGCGAVWLNNIGWVASTISGAGCNLWFSPDGITWTVLTNIRDVTGSSFGPNCLASSWNFISAQLPINRAYNPRIVLGGGNASSSSYLLSSDPF